MRNLRFYAISLAIHAVVLGPLACVICWTGFAPPYLSLRSGGGATAGPDLGDATVLEGGFVPDGQTVDLRLDPLPAAPVLLHDEVREAEIESRRLFAPSLETATKVRKIAPPIPELPSAPPPLAAAKAAPRVAKSVESPPPGPPQPDHKTARVDVGQLLKGSVGAQAALSPGNGLPNGRPVAGRSALRSGGGGSDGMPTGVTANVRPPYPPEALARGVEGRVLLRVVVDEEGTVRSASVETSSGDTSLDQSALTTVRNQWHFEPARRYGVPVECEVLVPIRFRLRAGG